MGTLRGLVVKLMADTSGFVGGLTAATSTSRSVAEQINTSAVRASGAWTASGAQAALNQQKIALDARRLTNEIVIQTDRLNKLRAKFGETKPVVEQARIKIEGLQMQLDSLGKHQDTAKTSADKLNTAVSNSVPVTGRSIAAWTALGNIVGTVALKVGQATVSFASDAIKEAADFEQTLNVLQATGDATDEQMKNISATAIKLGADITLPGTSAKDAAKSMTELVKAGVSVDQSLNAARGTLQLARAGELDEAEAAKIVANALNTFNLEGKEATRIADLLAAASNSSSGEVVDFAAGLQQSGAVAKMFNLSIDDTVTSLALLANQGVIGSDAGTSLKTALMKLINPTKEAREVMQQYGISVIDAQGKIKPYPEIIKQFSSALGVGRAMTVSAGGATKQQTKDLEKLGKQIVAAEKHLTQLTKAQAKANQQAKIDDLKKQYQTLQSSIAPVTSHVSKLTEAQHNEALATIFGSDAIRAAQIVFSGGVESYKDMYAATTKTGAAQRLAEARSKGLSGAIDALKSSLETAGLVASQRFLAPLADVAIGGAEMIGIFTDKIGLAFDAFDVAKAHGASNAQAFQDSIGVMFGPQAAQSFGKFRTIATQVINDVRPVATAIVGAFQNALVWLGANWPTFALILGTVIANVSGFVQTNIVPVVNVIIQALGMAISWVANNWPAISKVIVDVINAAGIVLNTVVTPIVQFVISQFQHVVSWVQTNWPLIQSTASIVFNALKSVFDAVLPVIGAVVTFVFDGIKTTIETTINTVLGIVKATMQILNGDWSGAWATIQQTVTGIWEGINKFFGGVPAQMLQIGKQIIDGLWKGIIANGDKVVQALRGLIDRAIADIKKLLGLGGAEAGAQAAAQTINAYGAAMRTNPSLMFARATFNPVAPTFSGGGYSTRGDRSRDTQPIIIHVHNEVGGREFDSYIIRVVDGEVQRGELRYG